MKWVILLACTLVCKPSFNFINNPIDKFVLSDTETDPITFPLCKLLMRSYPWTQSEKYYHHQNPVGPICSYKIYFFVLKCAKSFSFFSLSLWKSILRPRFFIFFVRLIFFITHYVYRLNVRLNSNTSNIVSREELLKMFCRDDRWSTVPQCTHKGANSVNGCTILSDAAWL